MAVSRNGSVQYRSRFLSRWRAGYLVLTSTAISLYRNPTSKRVRRRIPVKDLVCVEALNTSSERRQFCLEFHVSSGPGMVIAAGTAAERDEWLQALKVHCERTRDWTPSVTRSPKLFLESEVLEDLHAVLSSAGPASRQRAARALLEMGPSALQTSLQLLCKLVAAETDPVSQRLALLGLAKLYEHEFSLGGSERDSNAQLRLDLAEILGQFKPSSIPEFLRSANGSEVYDIQLACTTAMAKLDQVQLDASAGATSFQVANAWPGQVSAPMIEVKPMSCQSSRALQLPAGMPETVNSKAWDHTADCALTAFSEASTSPVLESTGISETDIEDVAVKHDASTEFGEDSVTGSVRRKTGERSLRSDCTSAMPDMYSLRSC